jgi:hypothetical protein
VTLPPTARPAAASDHDSRADTPGGPITSKRVVPCSWQKTLRVVPRSGQATHAER